MINKVELVNRVVAKNPSYKKYQVKNIMEDIFAEIACSLQENEKVAIRGFGTFDVKTYKEHAAVHPTTKEAIMIPSFKNVVFSPGDGLTKAIRGE